IDAQLNNADTGRTVVTQSTLARSLLARVAGDIGASLGPTDPRYLKNQSSQLGTTGTDTGQGTTGTTAGAGANTNTGAANPGSTSSSMTTGTTDMTSTSAQITFNLGVQGDSARLTVYHGRRPREQSAPGTDPTVSQPQIGDLRRVTYWLGDGKGLYRQE